MSLHGKRVLFISYNGMLDPLGQSQVIPYLKELSKLGVQFTLVSFERPHAFTSDGQTRTAQLQHELSAGNIDWRRLRYHKSPSLPATAYDVFAGTRLCTQLLREKKIQAVHARSHIPAVIALRLKERFGIKMIFDVRGLMADEYVDADHWGQDSLPYRLTKSAERRALRAADGVVTLTERIWPIISSWDSLRNRNVIHEVVPCCADLDLFRFDQTARDLRRAQLGIDNRFVLVYSGSIDGWYLTKEMADFFSVLRRRNARAHMLWLTPTRHERIHSLMRQRAISESDYSVIAAVPHQVPSYLSAADAALAFIKPCFSKLASSPTKYAEYLACGLPLIINAGIGDSDSLITGEKTGALIHEFNEREFDVAANLIESLAANAEQARRHAREVAERLFDVRGVGVERYARLYARVVRDEGS